jgi:hypothetical protein
LKLVVIEPVEKREMSRLLVMPRARGATIESRPHVSEL